MYKSFFFGGVMCSFAWGFFPHFALDLCDYSKLHSPLCSSSMDLPDLPASVLLVFGLQ